MGCNDQESQQDFSCFRLCNAKPRFQKTRILDIWLEIIVSNAARSLTATKDSKQFETTTVCST